jgi:fucose 4-O-acetylase-like acetyltransferase
MSEADSGNETDIQKAVRLEQFWYTATMIGFNGLLMSHKLADKLILPGIFTSLFLSVYAVALITNRARKYEDNSYRASALKNFVSNMWTVAREMEGAFFIVLLVIASCCGAVATNF